MKLSLTFSLLILGVTAGFAGDLIVKVTGLKDAKGEVGCALYGSASGFPMDSSKAKSVWLKAKPESIECRFEGIPAGKYAVAVSVDVNGNRKTDTNFMGIPKEDWGVSNNVRPKLRAPRFDEAVFEVSAGETRIEIGVGR